MDEHRLVLEFARTKAADDPYAIKMQPQFYNLRSADKTYERAELSWDESLVASIEALRAPRRDPEILQRLGNELRAFLKPTGWALHESALLEAAEPSRRVVITIRSAAAELYALPWELCTLGQTMRHLGELPNVLLRYEWPGSTTVEESPSPRPKGGRILFACSHAGGRVPSAEHIKAIADACDAGNHSFDPDTDVLSAASPRALREALAAAKQQNKPIAVLHLLCHGGPVGNTFGLMLDADEDGGSSGVDAVTLAKLIGEHADMVRMVVIAACDGGNIGALGNHVGSVAQAIHRAGIAAVVASRYPFSIKGSNAFTEAFYRELLVPPSSVEQAFVTARQHLVTTDTQHIDWASLQLYGREDDGTDSRPIVIRPYRGLLPLSPAHSRFFFGRDREAVEIVRDLGALVKAGLPRFLIVQGWSGTGKSSMVMAGAVPRLTKPAEPAAGAPGDDTWSPGFALAVMKPGRDPMTALDRELLDREKRRPALLVVDQFEEVFTQASAASRDAFCRKLWQLACDPASGISVLLTVRSDFIGRCGEVILDDQGNRLDAVANTEVHSVRVSQLSQEQLRETIEKPAAMVGITMDPSLVNRILREIGAALGALPLVAHMLHLLWLERSEHKLTMEAYERLGTVTGALHQHADKLIDELDDTGRRMAERVFVGLVSREADPDAPATATRRRLSVKEIRDELCGEDPARQASFDEMLRVLWDGRLVVTEGEGDLRTLDVAHEALIRGWKRLDGWIESWGDMLRRRKEIDRWVALYKSHGTLLLWKQIAAAEDFKKHYPDAFSQEAAKLLKASVRRVTMAKVRTAVVVAVSVIAAVGMGVLGIGAYRNARSAQREKAAALEAKKVADEQAQSAADATLIAGAHERMARNDPVSAMQLLRYVKRPDKRKDWLRLALETMKSSPVRALEGHEGAVIDVAFSRDGNWVATASEDNVARVFHVQNRATVYKMVGHTGAVTSVAFSRDGEARWIATGSADGTARVWNARDPRQFEVLRHDAGVDGVDFSADNDVLTLSVDGKARLWRNALPAKGGDAPTAELLAQGTSRVESVSFDESGNHIITALQDGTARISRSKDLREEAVIRGKAPLLVAELAWKARRAVTIQRDESGIELCRVWDIGGARPQSLFDLPISSSIDINIRSLGLGEDGVLVVGYSDGDAVVMDTTKSDLSIQQLQTSADDVGRHAPGALKAHKQAIVAAKYNARSRLVLTASSDGVAKVWTNEGGGDFSEASVMRHPAEIRAAAWSPEGNLIVTGSTDRVAHLWRAERKDTIALPRDISDVTFNAATGAMLLVFRHTIAADDAVPVYAKVSGTAKGSWIALEDSTASAGTDPPPISLIAFSQDGRVVAGVTADDLVRVWHLEEATGGERSERVVNHPFVLPDKQDSGIPDPPNLTPDGTGVLLVSNGEAMLHPTRAGSTATVFEGHQGKIVCASLSADGSSVVAGADDGAAYLWSVDAPAAPKRRLRDDEDFKEPIAFVGFSRTGERIFTLSREGVGRIWSVSGQDGDGGCLRDRRQGEGCLRGLRVPSFGADGAWIAGPAISADGRWIAAVSAGAVALRWSVDALDDPRPLGEPRASSIAFDEKSERAVIGFEDGKAQIWSVADAKLMAELSGHTTAIEWAEFTPDGGEVATISSSGDVRLWVVDIPAVQMKIRGSALDCLPKDQLVEYLDGTGLDPDALHRSCESGHANDDAEPPLVAAPDKPQ